jgi:hypothetical protein
VLALLALLSGWFPNVSLASTPTTPRRVVTGRLCGTIEAGTYKSNGALYANYHRVRVLSGQLTCAHAIVLAKDALGLDRPGFESDFWTYDCTHTWGPPTLRNV